MIIEKEYAQKIYRIRQDYLTRLDSLRLGMNEYVHHMPSDFFEEILNTFTIEKASAYPEVNEAYNALAQYLDQSRDRIILTSGADMALDVVFRTFCNAGDYIVSCGPTFAMYKIHASLMDCKYYEEQCNKDGDFSEHQLLSLVAMNPKIIVLANPSGVTGFCFSKEVIKKALCETEKHDILLVLDETYANFDNIDMSEFLDTYNNLVIVRSFSKCIGLAGMRIGYILSSEYLTNMMEKFRPMMEINAFAVEAVKAICNNPHYLLECTQNIRDNRDYLANNLRNLGYFVIEKKGNFILVDFGEERSKIENKLKDNNVEFRALSGPLANYIRFTIGDRNAMDLLIRYIKESN